MQLNAGQYLNIVQLLRQGFFWQPVYMCKKYAGCSYDNALKYVSDLSENLPREENKKKKH